MRTTLYLMRHGETDWNCAHRMQGHADVPLNETGRAQAKAAGARLAGLAFGAVYASPLQRARRTAQLATGLPEEKILADSRLLEMGFGAWEGVPVTQMPAAFFDKPSAYVPPADGESFPGVMTRTADFLQDVMGRHHGQRILAVTHGAALRCIALQLTGAPLDELWNGTLVDNCAILVVEDDGSGPRLARRLPAEESW